MTHPRDVLRPGLGCGAAAALAGVVIYGIVGLGGLVPLGPTVDGRLRVAKHLAADGHLGTARWILRGALRQLDPAFRVALDEGLIDRGVETRLGAGEVALGVAEAWLALGRPAEALPSFEVAWATLEKDAEARLRAGLRLAQCLRATGRPDEAGEVEALALALDVPPSTRRERLREINPAALDR